MMDDRIGILPINLSHVDVDSMIRKSQVSFLGVSSLAIYMAF